MSRSRKIKSRRSKSNYRKKFKNIRKRSASLKLKLRNEVKQLQTILFKLTVKYEIMREVNADPLTAFGIRSKQKLLDTIYQIEEFIQDLKDDGIPEPSIDTINKVIQEYENLEDYKNRYNYYLK
jgi:hypothetical protein